MLCCQGFLFTCFAVVFWVHPSSKKTVLLPSTWDSVVSLLGRFCLWSHFQGFNSSLAECLLLACVPLSSRSDCLVLLTWFFSSLTHVLSLARFARPGILFPPAYQCVWRKMYDQECPCAVHLKCFHTLSNCDTHQYQFLLVPMQHQCDDIVS